MKTTKLLLPILALAISGAAHAGKTGAGPAANASTGVGSIVVPGSNSILGTLSKDEAGNALVPGQSGIVILTGDQLAQASATLGASPDAVVDGAIIRAPTTLGDGGAATIVLNTQTGELLIVRKED